MLARSECGTSFLKLSILQDRTHCQEELLQQEGGRDMQAMSGLCRATVSASQHILGLSEKFMQQQ